MNIKSTIRMVSRPSAGRKALLSALAVIGMTGNIHADIGTTISGGSTAAGTYNSLSGAITALNTSSITAPVTLTLTAGSTEVLSAGIQLTATGTAAAPILIQKSGSGANPQLQGFTGIGTNDIMFALIGSDYVTIDGLDLNNATASSGVTAMDFGYVLARGSASNGCQNVVIKNSTIRLDATKSTMGVQSRPADYSNTAVAPASFAGTNSLIAIQSDSITATQGISFNAAVPAVSTVAQIAGLRDSANTVGGPNAADGNFILYGSSSVTAAANGVAEIWNYAFTVQNNKIGNDDGSNTNSCAAVPNRAIFLNQSSHGAGALVANNVIKLRSSSSTSSATVSNANLITGIHSEMGYNYVAGSKISIKNNDISADLSLSSGGTPVIGIFYNSKVDTFECIHNEMHNVTAPNGSTGKPFYFCYANTGGTGTGVYLKVDSNYVHDISLNTTTPLTLMLPYAGYAGYEINGNTISGISKTVAAGTGNYAIQITGAATSTASSISGNTISGLHTTFGTMYGIYFLSGVATAPVKINSNSISNLSNIGGSAIAAINTLGSGVTFPLGSSISGNTINAITGNNAQTTGISWNGSGPSLNISQNTISNINSPATTSGPVTGIYVVGTTGSTVNTFANSISDIHVTGVSTGATAAASGITTGTNNVTHYIYNNQITNLSAPSCRNNNGVCGISLGSNTQVAYIYFNTIYPGNSGYITSSDT